MARVTAIRKPAPSASKPPKKTVAATQHAIDDLAYKSGTWSVKDVPGLFIRCTVHTKSFFVQRRVNGKLKSQPLGEMSMKDAKQAAGESWSAMRRPEVAATGRGITFAEAYQRYIDERKLAPDTIRNYKLNFNLALKDWQQRKLRDIGDDLAGMRSLQHKVARERGEATANQVVRLVSCVYEWQRRIDRSLPECPTSAVELFRMEPRNSAYSLEELPAWYERINVLGPVDRMRHLVALLTGARQESVRDLQWEDVSIETKVMKFFTTKRQKYAVPMSDILTALMAHYRDSAIAPPSRWVFPSPVIDDQPWGDLRESPHRLRHTFKTHCIGIVSAEESKILMGHSAGGDVNLSYATLSLVLEGLRPAINRLAEKYATVLPQLRV